MGRVDGVCVHAIAARQEKLLRGTPEANPRVPPTPPLEVMFELGGHLRVRVSKPRVEQGFDRVYGASKINI